MRTLAGLGGRVATVGTGGLLDVERPLAYRFADSPVSSLSLLECVIISVEIDKAAFPREKFANLRLRIGGVES